MTNPEWIFERLFDVRTILDILVVAILLYWLLWVVQGTRASSLIRGIATLFVLLFVLGSVLELQTLNVILAAIYPALIVAIPVIFQP